MTQTAITINQALARAGLLYDSHSAKTIQSKLAEGVINFGRAVVLGTDPERQVKATTSAADTFVGAIVHDHARESQPGSDPAEIGDEGSAAVITLGPIWVETFETVVPGNPVSVEVAAGSANMKFGTDPTGNIVVANAKWIKGVTGAGLAVLEIQ